MKTVMIGDRRFKLPFIDLIPFDKDQLAELRQSIKDDGEIHIPAVAWKENKDTIIEGAHRAIFAAEFGLKLPLAYKSFKSEDDAREFCEKVNFERRHLSQEQLKVKRKERLERIAAARANGHSQRQIAEEEGISKTQVHDDIKEIKKMAEENKSTGHPRPVEPPDGKVTGKDGKKRDARTKKLCERCERVGETPNCKMCADMRSKGGTRKKGDAYEPTKVVKNGDVLHDNHGTEIPKKRRDIWADPWFRKTLDWVCGLYEEFRMERFPEGMNKRAKFFPFVDHKRVVALCGFIMQFFDEIIDIMKKGMPDAVCPDCNGDGCDKCRGIGLVPKEVHKKLKERQKC